MNGAGELGTCFGSRLPSGFLPKLRRGSDAVDGVRSSCDMLARNSDLYFEGSVRARSPVLERAAGRSDLLVLALRPRHCAGKLLRLSRAAHGRCSSFCCVCMLAGELLRYA